MKNYVAETVPNSCIASPQRTEGPIWHGQARALTRPGRIADVPHSGRPRSGLPARPTRACSQSNRAPRPPQAAAGGRWHGRWVTRPGLVPAARRRGRSAEATPRSSCSSPGRRWRGGSRPKAPSLRPGGGESGRVMQVLARRPRRLPLGLSPRAVTKARPPPPGAIKPPGGPRGALALLAPRALGPAARLTRSSRL